MEMITGLRFLFENYKPRSWYWELVEMSRKVILTSALILVGQESRSYIGLTLVIAGMYGMLFSWIRPMQDVFENRLMSTSLAVTIVNLAVGAVSRIPAENTLSSGEQYADAVLFRILVLGANVSVIGLLVGRILLLLLMRGAGIAQVRIRPGVICGLSVLLVLALLRGFFSGFPGFPPS